MSSDRPRRLFWVPIIHTSADLGSLRTAVRRIHEDQAGQHAWQDRVRQIGQLWRSIRSSLLQQDLDWPRVLLYQDGLPVCGKEDMIVQDLSRNGSANHRLLVELIARGARLVGTESPELLIEEYELNRRVLLDPSARAEGFEARTQALFRDLLDRRDAFIASRIDETLPAGGVGCLFLGLMHQVEGRLPTEIELCRLGGQR